MVKDIFTYSFVHMSLPLAVLLIATAAFMIVLVLKHTKRGLPSPPGPWGLPIIGYYLFLGREPHVTFMQIRKKYGNVFQLQIGSWQAVVVNGDAIKEALVKKGDDFSDRPSFYSSSCLQQGKSLSFGHFNVAFLTQLKLVQKALGSAFCAKRCALEKLVEAEVDYLVETFMSSERRSVNPAAALQIATGSIIYQICYGIHGNMRQKKDFINFYLTSSSAFMDYLGAGNQLDLLPWLQIFQRSKIMKFKKLVAKMADLRNVQVRKHARTFSEDNSLDVTDELLNAVKAVDDQEMREQIIGSLEAIVGAGWSTVSGVLKWMLLLFAENPNVQSKVHEEIVRVLGTSRRPSLSTKGKMPYVQATLNEIIRWSAFTPITIPHATTRDTELQGYAIPKGTMVLINLYSLSHDEEKWGDPNVFRPERFLDGNGQLNTTFHNFMPFSAGRRKCLGESLARNELFLFLTGLAQRCLFEKPDDVANYNIECKFGLHRPPPPFTVTTTLRDESSMHYVD